MILPIIHQRLGGPADEITGFHVAETATSTHRFTLLAIEHARDTSPPGHDWDLEGVLLVEGADGLEGMWTQAHFDIKCYSGLAVRLVQARRLLPGIWITWGDGIIPRPLVWIEAKGHGIHGEPVGEDPTETYDYYNPVLMFGNAGLWTKRKELFTQDEHGRWMRGGAHAPWSWAGRTGYPGLVATDPAAFCLESGVQGWSPMSRHYVHNPFLNVLDPLRKTG